MCDSQSEISLVDILFDNYLLDLYAQQECEKFIQLDPDTNINYKYLYIMGVATPGPATKDYYISKYEDWKKTVCKLCEPNPKKERYYRKLARLELRQNEGMDIRKPQRGIRERYPDAFADDDPTAPDYGLRITRADVLADDTLLELWASQQWDTDNLEEAKQAFRKFKDDLIVRGSMPPMQILHKFRKDKIRTTGIDAGYFDVSTAKQKYPDFFSEDNPDKSGYATTITIADIFIYPELIFLYCKQPSVHIYGTNPVNEVIEKTKERIEGLRRDGKVPDKHELMRYKAYRDRLRKKHNIQFSENGILQG